MEMNTFILVPWLQREKGEGVPSTDLPSSQYQARNERSSSAHSGRRLSSSSFVEGGKQSLEEQLVPFPYTGTGRFLFFGRPASL